MQEHQCNKRISILWLTFNEVKRANCMVGGERKMCSTEFQKGRLAACKSNLYSQFKKIEYVQNALAELLRIEK